MTRNECFKKELYPFSNKEFAITQLMKEYLIKLYSIFKYGNLPDNFTKRNIETYIMRGHCEIIEHKDQLWPMMGGLCGVEKSPVYDYTQSTIANPALNISKTYTDGVDCVIIRNDPLYQGVYELLRRYCSILVEGNLSLYNYAAFNSRVPALISAADSDTRDSANDFIEDVIKGKYSIIATSKLFESLQVNEFNNGSNGILSLLEMLQYTQAELNKTFGLSSNNNRKREALSSDETSTDDSILLPFIDIMLEERQEGIDKVNKLFGTNITVEKNSSWKLIEEEMEAVVENIEDENEEDIEETDEEKEEVKEEEKDDETNS